MRNFIAYVVLDYFILLSLISALAIFLHITLGEYDYKVIIMLSSIFIIPLWLIFSYNNNIVNFGKYLGYKPILINRIKKNIYKTKEYSKVSFCYVWKIHLILLSALGLLNLISFVISMFLLNIYPIVIFQGIITVIVCFSTFIVIYYIYGYKFHRNVANKFKAINYINEGKKVLEKYNLIASQDIGKNYFSQKLDYKNGYRWFFLTWFSAKTPIPADLQQYIDSRDKALINLFLPDPNAEDPLEKALFPLWAYIYWTLIGNDDDVREKYYQEAAKIGFDDTQWQLFCPKQISATA